MFLFGLFTETFPMNFIQQSASEGLTSWPALLSLNVKSVLEPELTIPEESFDFGSFSIPSVFSQDFGSFTSPSLELSDFGLLS